MTHSCLSHAIGGALFPLNLAQRAEDLTTTREFLHAGRHHAIVDVQVTERWRTELLVPVPGVVAEL